MDEYEKWVYWGIGSAIIVFSLLLVYLKEVKNIGKDNKVVKFTIRGHEYQLPSSASWIIIIGIVLLLVPKIDKHLESYLGNGYGDTSSNKFYKAVDQRIEKIIKKDVLNKIDSGYSRTFKFTPGTRNDEFLLFYAGKDQYVQLNFNAPYRLNDPNETVKLRVKVNNKIILTRELPYPRDTNLDISKYIKEEVERNEKIHVISFQVIDDQNNDYFSKRVNVLPMNIECVVLVKKTDDNVI